MTPSKTAIIGGGAWGTALAIHAGRLGLPVNLWVFEADLCSRMIRTRENEVFLPGFTLPAAVVPTNSLEEALRGARLVLSVVPSHVLRRIWEQAQPFLEEGAVLVSATKGVEQATGFTPAGILAQVLGTAFPVLALSGPTFAKEVAQGLPAAAVVAGEGEAPYFVQKALHSDAFRLYTNRDVIGVEIGGALKNVMAIAAGLSDGLGLGNNARAALITRGLAELARLGMALGASPLTFQGLAGMGDLVLTCTGDLSRNRTLGVRLGRGEALSAITSSSPAVAEGVKTARSALDLAEKKGVDMPITREVHSVLYQGKDPREAVAALMGRSMKEEG